MGEDKLNLIYKGNCDRKEMGEREDIANYRPLVMLNVDYKLVAKACANRIQKVANEIINLQQTGFVSHR